MYILLYFIYSFDILFVPFIFSLSYKYIPLCSVCISLDIPCIFPYIPCIFLLYSPPRIYSLIFLVYSFYIPFVPHLLSLYYKDIPFIIRAYSVIFLIYSYIYSVYIPFVSPRVCPSIFLVYSLYVLFVPPCFLYIINIFPLYPVCIPT